MVIIKYKKAQEDVAGGHMLVVIGFIILVLGTFTLMGIIKKETDISSNLEDTAECYTSIIGSMFSSKETKVKCPLTYYKIYKKSIKELKDGKEVESELIKDFSLTDKKINELFMKLMGNCLQNSGGVNSKAFSRGWLSSSVVCLQCYNIEFDKDVGVSFKGLREYIENTKVPSSDKKFIELFTKDEAHKEDWINYGINNDLLPGKYESAINSGDIYTVAFIGIKEGTTSALLDARIIGREDTYFVYAAPQDKFNKICDRYVN